MNQEIYLKKTNTATTTASTTTITTTTVTNTITTAATIMFFYYNVLLNIKIVIKTIHWELLKCQMFVYSMLIVLLYSHQN